MSKLAIDIALLPPDSVMNEAIKINKDFEPKLILNKTDCLPHITLSQAVIKEEDLGQVKEIIETIVREFHPLKLHAKVVNKPGAFFRITETPQIKKLHLEVMSRLKDLVSYDAKPEYFYDDYIREQSLEWVSDFYSGGAFEKFDAHISLGVEQLVEDEHELKFIADRLVICHLGNYNTCRKILYEVALH